MAILLSTAGPQWSSSPSIEPELERSVPLGNDLMKPRLDLFGRKFGTDHPLAPADRMMVFDALPEKERDELWESLKQQREDERFAEGVVDFRPRRGPKRQPPYVPAVGPFGDDWRRGNNALNSIEAEMYLEVLTGAGPSRGRCHCPLPDHEDRHPSASYKDNVWYCHRCGVGGSIFTLGAALTGLRSHGEDFLILRKWLAQQMLGGLS